MATTIENKPHLDPRSVQRTRQPERLRRPESRQNGENESAQRLARRADSLDDRVTLSENARNAARERRVAEDKEEADRAKQDR
jgi:hypothetical protein